MTEKSSPKCVAVYQTTGTSLVLLELIALVYISQQTVFSFLHMLIPSNPVISTGSWTNSDNKAVFIIHVLQS